jgi:hypothetical protein
MVESEQDVASGPTTKRALRPIYLKALAATVALLVIGSPGFARFTSAFVSSTEIWWWLELALIWAPVALVAETVVLAPIAWSRIRSQGREASRSYGAMAILGATSGVGFGMLNGLWSTVMFFYGRGWLSQYGIYYLKAIVVPSLEYVVVSIAAAWTTLALTGAGRKSSGVFERLGLGLGWCWIATYLARHALDIALRLR